MSSSRRKTIAGVLSVSGLPLVLGGMAVVSAVSVVLGAGVLFEREGETAFPTIVAEYFWIGVWILLSGLVVLAVGWGLFCLVARRFARPIARLTAAAERAAVARELQLLDANQELDELHRLAASFNRLLSERERKSEEIRNLSRSVLHDIHSPVVKISDEADNLAHGLVDKDMAAMSILKQSRLLTRLIETNAEISRNYGGCNCAQTAKVDFAAIVRDVAEVYAAAAEDRHIALDCKVPETPVFFDGHVSKLQRLVSNLLDNAVKFTPECGRVEVALVSEGPAVVLTVSDTGCGIAESERELVYERFYRCASSKDLPGSGLGLSMVHSIVALYHGDIVCASTVGKGTTFRVTLR